MTNINFGQERLHDCAATCKARYDSIEHEMRARFKTQLKAGRDMDGVASALQASRARHAERAAEVKDLESRLSAAESGLAAALSAQKLAVAEQTKVAFSAQACVWFSITSVLEPFYGHLKSEVPG